MILLVYIGLYARNNHKGRQKVTDLVAGQHDPVSMVERLLAQKELAATTSYRYGREVKAAVSANINLFDRDSVASYAADLPTSRKRFLKAAVRLLANELSDQAQSEATAENIDMVQSLVYRAERLKNAITVKESRGQAARTWLTPLETKTLLSLPDVATVKGRRDRVVLALLVGAGLRRSEAVRLTWQQVLEQGGRTLLSITGKGEKQRVVPISSTLAAWLTDWQAETAGGANDNVCISIGKGGRLGSGLSGQGILAIVEAYGRMLDKPDVRPHDLRRTYARIGYDAGIDIGQISLLLGHSSIATTQNYLGLKIDSTKTVSDFVPM
jgi:site-specific recombinase XerD